MLDIKWIICSRNNILKDECEKINSLYVCLKPNNSVELFILSFNRRYEMKK